MNNSISWNKTIIDCFESNKFKQLSEICFKNTVNKIVIDPKDIDLAMTTRIVAQSKHLITIRINSQDQNKPGIDKFYGLPADAFDADGFELMPFKTENPAELLQDLNICSEFLRNSVGQQRFIGWNLSNAELKDNDVLTLFDLISKSQRPMYLRFGEDQGLICTLAKRAAGIKTVLPNSLEVESDFRSISIAEVLKIS